MPHKRKRDNTGAGVRFQAPLASSSSLMSIDSKSTNGKTKTEESSTDASTDSISFQVVTGSYDRVLHGIHVSIPFSSSPSSSTKASFKDLYRFHAHASSIRTLAISPVSSTSTRGKRLLATSSPDTKINLYHLHTRRSLGSLVPPGATTTTMLTFPSSKTLLSGDEEGNIHVWRTRDWSLLCSMKTPVSKSTKNNVNGIDLRGSVNDIAVHPTGKIALSVSKGERAVRLWNLMTGRKAGVMAFGKEDVPRAMTLGGNGEGARVRWRTGKEEGYAVCFDRGAVVFGMDARPSYYITPTPGSKVHQLKFYKTEEHENEFAIVGTEDGRIIVYELPPRAQATEGEGEGKKEVTNAPVVGTLGGRDSGVTGRVKDFDVITLDAEEEGEKKTFIVTAGSDGVVRVWDLHLGKTNNEESSPKKAKISEDGDTEMVDKDKKDIGTLVGTYETGHRITCMNAAEVIEGEDEDDEEEANGKDESGSDESSSEDDDEDEEEEQLKTN